MIDFKLYASGHALLPLPIITPRLTFRAPKESDMKAWVELYNDPLVREHFEGFVTRTESEWWSVLKARIGDP